MFIPTASHHINSPEVFPDDLPQNSIPFAMQYSDLISTDHNSLIKQNCNFTQGFFRPPSSYIDFWLKKQFSLSYIPVCEVTSGRDPAVNFLINFRCCFFKLADIHNCADLSESDRYFIFFSFNDLSRNILPFHEHIITFLYFRINNFTCRRFCRFQLPESSPPFPDSDGFNFNFGNLFLKLIFTGIFTLSFLTW